VTAGTPASVITRGRKAGFVAALKVDIKSFLNACGVWQFCVGEIYLKYVPHSTKRSRE